MVDSKENYKFDMGVKGLRQKILPWVGASGLTGLVSMNSSWAKWKKQEMVLFGRL